MGRDEFPEPTEEELEEFMGPVEPFEPPPFTLDLSTAIVVDNLPVVGKDKYDRLTGVLRKLYEQLGRITEPAGLFMPFDEAKNTTLGFAFINFEQVEDAEHATTATQNYKLGANILQVNRYQDLVKSVDLSEKWEAPPRRPFRPIENEYGWLTDAQFRDQMVIRYSNKTEVLWAEGNGSPTLVTDAHKDQIPGKTWCDLYLTWSNHGTYLTTFHMRGFQLWAGNFERVARLPHENAGRPLALFSKTDRYLVTYTDYHEMPDRQGVQREVEKATIIWDVKQSIHLGTEVVVKSWHSGYPYGRRNPFKWSPDDKFFAVSRPPKRNDQAVDAYRSEDSKDSTGEGKQLIYWAVENLSEVPHPTLVAEGIRDFEWSPKDNMIAYWAPEKGNIPAKVCLVELPEKKTTQKNIFGVLDCQLFWQSEGDFLCVKVTKQTRGGRRAKDITLELFRVREPEVPVERQEIKEPVWFFSWEPCGQRFAFIHGEEPARASVSFYSMVDPKAKTKALTSLLTLEKRNVNRLVWSPTGNFIVLVKAAGGEGAGERSSLEFFDVDSGQSLMKKEDLPRVDEVEWDPSGRFVVSVTKQEIGSDYWRVQEDNGFKVWTFQGALVANVERPKLYQFSWRPRPPSLLTAEQKKSIRRDLRKYERRFNKEDEDKQRIKKEEENRHKGALRRAFREFYQRRIEEIRAHRAQHISLMDGYDSEDDSNFDIHEEVIEKVVNVERRYE